ncbi:uncharacterized protein LOC111083514 [Limulus polyphemus]|uniref:Uncharacterized protein LOC111083514 n=1 Tax=Limulus polyphemus TaxID=6850 RepID=A0ABM1RWP4_LIMPO|nr:uncharacterized protein LOC111083514 [Limulus polyphemus]
MMLSERDMMQQHQCNYCSRTLSSLSALQRHIKSCQYKNLSHQENPGLKTSPPDANMNQGLTRNFILPPIPSQLTIMIHQEKNYSRSEEPKITLKKISDSTSKDEDLLYQNFIPTSVSSGSTTTCEETFSNFSLSKTRIKTEHNDESNSELAERTCTLQNFLIPQKGDFQECYITTHGDGINFIHKDSSSLDSNQNIATGGEFTQGKVACSLSEDSMIDNQLTVFKTEPKDVDNTSEVGIIQNKEFGDFQLDVSHGSLTEGALLEDINRCSDNPLSSPEPDMSVRPVDTYGSSTVSSCALQLIQVSCAKSSLLPSVFAENHSETVHSPELGNDDPSVSGCGTGVKCEVVSTSYSHDHLVNTLSQVNDNFTHDSEGSFQSRRNVSSPGAKKGTMLQETMDISKHSLIPVSVGTVFTQQNNNHKSGEPIQVPDRQQFSVCMEDNNFTDKDDVFTPKESLCSQEKIKSVKSKPPAKKPLLTCEVCNKTYRCRSSFKKHISGHAVATFFVCKYCGQTFQQKNIFLAHIDLHEQNALHLSLSETCRSNSQTPSSFLWKSRTVQSRFDTPISTQCLSTGLLQAVSKKQTDKRKNNSSNLLQDDLVSSSNLKSWNQEQFCEEQRTCETCDMIFQNVHEYVVHQRLCTGQKKTVGNYLQNSIISEGKKTVPITYKLDKSLAFSTKRLKKGNPSSVLKTKNTSKQLFCTICCRDFSKIENYVRHKRFHSYRCLVYTCQYCGQFFSKRVLLDFHEKNHRETRRCKYCNLPLTDKIALKQHMIDMHSGYRILLFSNNTTDFGFSRRMWDSPKILTSINNKTNKGNISSLDFANKNVCQCSHCLGEFGNREAMSRHVCKKPVYPQQLDQGKFFCDVCHQIFFSPEQLQEHLKHLHVKVDLYRCEVCGVWGRKEELERHVLAHMSKMGHFVSTDQKSFKVGGKFLSTATDITENSKSLKIVPLKKAPPEVFQKKQLHTVSLNKGKSKAKHPRTVKSGKLHEVVTSQNRSHQESNLFAMTSSHISQNQFLLRKRLLTNNSDVKGHSLVGTRIGKILVKNIPVCSQQSTVKNSQTGVSVKRIRPNSGDLNRSMLSNLSSLFEVEKVNQFTSQDQQTKILERPLLSSEEKQSENTARSNLSRNPDDSLIRSRLLSNHIENLERSRLLGNQSENHERGMLVLNNRGDTDRLPSKQTENYDRNRLSNSSNESENNNQLRNKCSENYDRNQNVNLVNKRSPASNNLHENLVTNRVNQVENLNRIKISSSCNPNQTSLTTGLDENSDRSRPPNFGSQHEQSYRNSPNHSTERKRLSISNEIEVSGVNELQKMGISTLLRSDSHAESSSSPCSASEQSEKDFMTSYRYQDKDLDNELTNYNSENRTIEISQLPVANNKSDNDDNRQMCHNKSVVSDTRKLWNTGGHMDRNVEYCLPCEEYIPLHLFSGHLLEKHMDGGERSDFFLDLPYLPGNEEMMDVSEEDPGLYEGLSIDDIFEEETSGTTLETELTSEREGSIIFNENNP